MWRGTEALAETLHYPTRPLKLAKRGSPLVGLIVVGLLFLPALISGGIALSNGLHAQAMQSRGVEADVLSGQSECTRVRRGAGAWRTTGCEVQVTYRVRPEHGGATLSGKTRVLNKPLFTPRIFYDPANPSSIIDEAVMRRGLSGGDFLSPAMLLLVPGLAILALWLGGRASLAKAAQAPRWEKVRVTRARRLTPSNMIELQLEGASGKTFPSVLPKGLEPLLTPPPPGAGGEAQWVLALVDASGRPYALDRDLQILDLTAEERAAALRLALS
jgi:hypothetical protein